MQTTNFATFVKGFRVDCRGGNRVCSHGTRRVRAHAALLLTLPISLITATPGASAHAVGPQLAKATNSVLIITDSSDDEIIQGFAATTPMEADGRASYTARIHSSNFEYFEPVPGVIVTFEAPPGVKFSASTCTTDAEGVCAVTFTSTVRGRFAIHAKTNGIDISNSPTPVAFK